MIFTKFESTDIVAGRVNRVSSGFWTDGSYEVTQSSLNTSSAQTVLTGSNSYDIQNGAYYYNVYYADQSHFSITYGDYYGSGSLSGSNSSYEYLTRPSKCIYTQYKNLLLTPQDEFFNFKTGNYTVNSSTDTTNTVTSSGIVIINFSADKYKDRVDEGLLEFSLSGANGRFTFIDDSILLPKSDVYNIISGSIINGVATPHYSTTGVITYKSVGLFYPKTGIVVLNANAISSSVGLALTGSFSSNANDSLDYTLNQKTLFQSIVKCNDTTFKVRKSEYLPSRQYFLRIKNRDYNYTNNPTYIADGIKDTKNNVVVPRGTIKIDDFIDNPKTYMTTVGLYDDNNELIAVAKLSQPVEKNFDNELLIRVKLDF